MKRLSRSSRCQAHSPKLIRSCKSCGHHVILHLIARGRQQRHTPAVGTRYLRPTGRCSAASRSPRAQFDLPVRRRPLDLVSRGPPALARLPVTSTHTQHHASSPRRPSGRMVSLIAAVAGDSEVRRRRCWRAGHAQRAAHSARRSQRSPYWLALDAPHARSPSLPLAGILQTHRRPQPPLILSYCAPRCNSSSPPLWRPTPSRH